MMTYPLFKQQRPAARFAAMAVALFLATLPAVVHAAPDLLSGEAAAQALAAAMGGGDAAAASGPAAAVPQSSVSISDLTAWQRALRTDPDLKFSPSAVQLVYGCSCISSVGASPSAAAALASGNATLAADAIAADGSGFAMPREQDPLIADAFALHSRPGAPHTIVLDFTGHTLRKGTWWGTSASKIGDVPIVTPPYDLDGNPSSFSTAELAAIVSIWRQVSEDYSAWNVDVTTEEPAGTDDEGDASLVGVGQRLILGKNSGWFDNVGGVAFVGGFSDALSGPVAFVFNDYPPSAAIAATHEVGHTFGLKHHGTVARPDGTGASGYYTGHGAWAPVMGVGYGKNVIQWSKGDYAYASEPTQDDMAVISNTLDSAPWSGGGRDPASAELVSLVAGGPTILTGIFTSGHEAHLYHFTASSSGTVNLTLSVNPKGPQGNSRTHLALKARILREATSEVVGAPFNNVGPSGIDGNVPTTPTYSFALPASGDYLVELAAARNGDAVTGYTEYGSSGTYSLSIEGGSGLLGGGGAGPANLNCFGTTTLQLTTAAGNCDSGIAVQAKDVYFTNDLRPAAVSPALGTVLTAGASRAFTATLDGASCTTTVKVVACPSPSADTVTCLNPSYTLASGQCDGKAVPPAELYRLAGPNGAAPSGTATTTLPADGVLGPGKHQIQVTASAGGATCTSVVTVTPCRPAVISTTTAVAVLSAPGVCAGTPAPSAVVSAATLGRGALSINARTSSTGSVVPMPLKAGKYYVQVVYPGGVTSTVSSSSVPISVTDVEDPVAAIKPAIVRDSRGFICARGGSSTSTTACVSLSTSTGVLDLADNCGVSSLTRSYQCASTQNACPSTMSSTTTKLCVPVKAGGGRIEATYLLTVTDKGGRKGQVMIPIAGYHYRDRPAGVTCYTA